ncbi:MAG TPA: ABC transporter ATP-binding protein, partial [Acidimicrobiales bacterium]|nr:ABC transporter ATP-binding protein [Acidimicrobiales bacterium]
SKWTAALVASRRLIGVLSMKRAIDDPQTLAAPTPAGVGTPRGPDTPEIARPPVYLTESLVDELTNVVIAPGLFTAVVPATPEEGSALLDRLGRFEDPPDGSSVLLGNTPLDRIPVRELRRHLVVLERSPVQMTTTVSEVLAGAGTSRAVVVEAAAATEVIDGLEGGYEAELPERWRTLSGGQRQRLALAQAMAGDPDILLLDDPTSAVDAHTEAAIADRLRGLRAGRTTVVTTTSPLLLSRADRVVLLDGAAVAVGTHAELLATEERYRDIVLRGTEAQSKWSSNRITGGVQR